MDSSIRPLTSIPHHSLVASTDFFYPLIEDPCIMGMIAASNVLSDVYAMGVGSIDTVLMILAASTDMPVAVRAIVTRQLIEGFATQCRNAGCDVSGGQSIQNPWPIIGGTASAVVSDATILLPVNAHVGDVLVLTKPLGIQVAVNVKQWSHAVNGDKWQRLLSLVPSVDRYTVLYAFHRAQSSMLRLNRTAAELMHRHRARASTDVTGFGILGHASNLASLQHDNVDFIIDTLPCIRGTMTISDALGMRLRDGTAAETSGGLLIAMTPADAASFIADIESIDAEPAWIIGRVVEGTKTARLAAELNIIES